MIKALGQIAFGGTGIYRVGTVRGAGRGRQLRRMMRLAVYEGP